MRAHPRSILIGLISIGVLAGCGSNGSPAGPNGGAGPVTARINGTNWSADSDLSDAQNFADGSTLFIRGISGTYTIHLYLDDVINAGTYALGQDPVRWAAALDQDGSHWSSDNPGGSGSVTITTFTQTRVAGTFQVTLPANDGSVSQATLNVTNGQFDIVLTQM